MNRHFHTEAVFTTREEFEAALRNAGIIALTREVSDIHQGYVFTALLLEGLWNYESGAEGCEGTPENPCNHRRWEELNEEQQRLFARDLASFLEDRRREQYCPSDGLELLDAFREVNTGQECEPGE